MNNRYRTNADDSIVCKHRDISCCDACLAADDNLVDIYGHVYIVDDRAVRIIAADRDPDARVWVCFVDSPDEDAFVTRDQMTQVAR